MHLWGNSLFVWFRRFLCFFHFLSFPNTPTATQCSPGDPTTLLPLGFCRLLIVPCGTLSPPHPGALFIPSSGPNPRLDPNYQAKTTQRPHPDYTPLGVILFKFPPSIFPLVAVLRRDVDVWLFVSAALYLPPCFFP